MNRNDVITGAWLAPTTKINDRDLHRMSFGRLEYLKGHLRNALVDGRIRAVEQDENHAMGEIAYVMYLTLAELKEAKRLPLTEWHERVSDWMLDSEEELPGVIIEITESLDRLKAAQMESEAPGKGEPAHAP